MMMIYPWTRSRTINGVILFSTITTTTINNQQQSNLITVMEENTSRFQCTHQRDNNSTKKQTHPIHKSQWNRTRTNFASTNDNDIPSKTEPFIGVGCDVDHVNNKAESKKETNSLFFFHSVKIHNAVYSSFIIIWQISPSVSQLHTPAAVVQSAYCPWPHYKHNQKP